MTDNQTFRSGGRIYEWSGGFGAIFVSHERGRSLGDVRMIECRLFYVYLIYSPASWLWWKRRVGWTLPSVTIEDIRTLRAQLFGVESVTAGKEAVWKSES